MRLVMFVASVKSLDHDIATEAAVHINNRKPRYTSKRNTWRANLKARLTDLNKRMSVALEAAVGHLSEPVNWL